MLKKLYYRFRRLLRYGAVGCANTAIDWCVFTLLTNGLDDDQQNVRGGALL